ncbi:acyltransferase family protein [Cupriavidus sp. RAF12]|uniref:acyltransferase family protein n=1 Tax=Cupriavidus sp. RAF12 TaxID=3233050 RepID=UPI003F93A373
MNSIRDSRLHFLDGLRGWGALVVLLAHTFGEGFPISDRVTLILSRMGIFNAGLAVWVFFVVSGFSLSIGFCRRHDPTILTGISLGRYARLAVPILVVALLLYLFFALGLVPSVEHRLPIFQAFLPTGPTLLNVFRFSLFDVFFAYDPAKTLIGPLWTMSFELWGSALVIGTLFVAGRLDRRVYLYAVLGVVTFLVDPIYTAFIIGLVLAEVHASGVMERNHSLWGKALLLIFGAGILCAGFLPVIGNRPGAYLVVAVMLTASSVFSRLISNFLSGDLSRFLGRISFPLYLIHGPLFLAYGNNAYRWIEDPTHVQKLLLNLSIVAICIGCATLLSSVDRLGIIAAKRFSGYIMSRRGQRLSGETIS